MMSFCPALFYYSNTHTHFAPYSYTNISIYAYANTFSENQYLDKAMRVLGVAGGSHDAHLRHAPGGDHGTTDHHIEAEHFHSLEDKVF
jgi:hypothetical protein